MRTQDLMYILYRPITDDGWVDGWMDGCTTHTARPARARWSDEVVMMTGGLPQVGSSEHLETQHRIKQ